MFVCGLFDSPIDLGSGGENVRKLSSKNFLSNFSGQTVRTTLYTVGVERGMTWEKALLIWREHASPEDGFYLSTQVGGYYYYLTTTKSYTTQPGLLHCNL